MKKIISGAVFTGIGIEEIAVSDIKKYCNVDAKVEKSGIFFECNPVKLSRLTYLSQSVLRVMHHLKTIDLDSPKDLVLGLSDVPFEDYISENDSFSVRCIRRGDHSFTGEDVSRKGGEGIINRIEEKTGRRQKVNLTSPDIPFLAVVIDNKCHFGIDYSGFDLGKRDYKIFSISNSLNGTVAYSLLKILDYTKDDVLVVPSCRSGTIAIEAALLSSGFPLHFFQRDSLAFPNFGYIHKNFGPESSDEIEQFLKKKSDKEPKVKKIFAYDPLMRNVMAAKKNSKIAGIKGWMEVTKVDLEWLDTKYEENTVDLVATHMPLPRNIADGKMIQKLYDELFYQSDYILKEGGKLGVLVRNPEPLKKTDHKSLKLVKEVKLNQGQQEMYVLVFQKPPSKG